MAGRGVSPSFPDNNNTLPDTSITSNSTAGATLDPGANIRVRGSGAAPPTKSALPSTSDSSIPVVLGVIGSVVLLGLVLGFFVNKYRRGRQCERGLLPPKNYICGSRSPSKHRRVHSRTSSLTSELGMSSINMPKAVLASASRRGVSMSRPERSSRAINRMDCVFEEEEETETSMNSPLALPPSMFSQSSIIHPASLSLSASQSKYLLDQRRDPTMPNMSTCSAPWSSTGSTQGFLHIGSTKAANILSRTLTFMHHPSDKVEKPLSFIQEEEDAPGATYTYRFPSTRPVSVGSVESVHNMGYRIDRKDLVVKKPLRVINQ